MFPIANVVYPGPALLVLHPGVPGSEAWAIFDYGGQHRLGYRWNGNNINPLGFPYSQNGSAAAALVPEGLVLAAIDHITSLQGPPPAGTPSLIATLVQQFPTMF
jgi:hypothetical protein